MQSWLTHAHVVLDDIILVRISYLQAAISCKDLKQYKQTTCLLQLMTLLKHVLRFYMVIFIVELIQADVCLKKGKTCLKH